MPIEPRSPGVPGEPSRPARTLRKSLSRIGLAVVGFTVAVLLAEAALRLFTDEGPSSTVRDAVVSRRYLRAFEARVRVEESGRTVLLRFNRDGFRGPDRPLAKPAGVRRVAVLGDSMVAAVGIDEERTFVALAEGRLSNGTEPANTEVMNFGVAGSSPGIESILYEAVVSQYAPDVVLCAWFAGNDFGDDCAAIGGRRQVAYDLDAEDRLVRRPLEAATPVLSEWLAQHSRFYIWQKSVLARIRPDDAAAGGPRPGLRVYDTGADADLARGWKIQEAILEHLAGAVRARGSKFALVMLPEAAQVYDDVWRDAMNTVGPTADSYDAGHPGRRLAGIAARLGVPFLDLTPAFRAAAPHASVARKDEWLFLNGTGHLDDAGHRVAADALTPFLAGLLAPDASSPSKPDGR